MDALKSSGNSDMWLCRMDFDFFEINSFYNIELYCNNSFVWSDQYCIWYAWKTKRDFSMLINRLIQDGRNTEIQSVATDKEIRQRLYKEYGI